LFSSRFFVGLLIPAIIIGFAIWFVATADLDRGNVKVAGALVGAPDVRFSVVECKMAESGGVRKVLVKVEALNRCPRVVDIHPREFHLILAERDNLASLERQRVFIPMQYRSVCPEAPLSAGGIPPSSTRTVDLVFWGETLPRGGEWSDYLLSLEYYDAGTPLMFSKILNPNE
jgi:hypothetical protein